MSSMLKLLTLLKIYAIKLGLENKFSLAYRGKNMGEINRLNYKITIITI